MDAYPKDDLLIRKIKQNSFICKYGREIEHEQEVRSVGTRGEIKNQDKRGKKVRNLKHSLFYKSGSHLEFVEYARNVILNGSSFNDKKRLDDAVLQIYFYVCKHQTLLRSRSRNLNLNSLEPCKL